MIITEHHGGISLYKENKSFIVKTTISVRTFDSFELHDITFMKIDVENHENEVLQGAKETILRCRPIILLENNNHFFPHIFPNPEPHKAVLEEFRYIKSQSNLCNSGMDLWIPKPLVQ